MSIEFDDVMDFDTLIEFTEARYACSDIARSDVSAKAIHTALVKAGDDISLAMVRKIVKAQREHHIGKHIPYKVRCRVCDFQVWTVPKKLVAHVRPCGAIGGRLVFLSFPGDGA